MKRTVLIINLTLLFIMPSFGQNGDIESTFEERINRLDLYGGLHTGAFDCNQTNKYPYNFGANLLLQFTPNINIPWFVGLEIGSFVVKGEEAPDNYGRKTNLTLINGFLHVGYEFELTQASETSKAISMRMALGLPYVDHLKTASVGIGFLEPDRSLGIGFLGMINLPNKVSLFGSLYRLNRDLDGFGNVENGSGVVAGNKSDVTYIYKFGIMWRILPLKN